MGRKVKALSVGSTEGIAAAKRSECDVAPIHLLDPGINKYNKPFMTPAMTLTRGYRRMQGIVFRPGDRRFDRLSAEAPLRRRGGIPAA